MAVQKVATRQSKRQAKLKADKARLAASKQKPRQIVFRRPWLYKEQEEFLYTKARYSVVEASTKVGKTFGCIVWFVEQAAIYGGPNKNFWWIAPVFGQAEIAFRRIIQYCPKELIKWNNQKLTITLANGAVMWFKSADKPDSLYGEDVYAAVVDEASRMKAEAWYAIRSTLTATRGPIRIIGNVKGKKNWAYRLARKAEAGANNTYFARLDAYAAVRAGILAKEEIDDAEATLPPDVFRELYLAIPTEDGSNPFGHDKIRECMMQGTLAPGPAVAFGVDVARVVDWTVIVGLNRLGQVCYFHRLQQRPWPEIEDTIVQAIKQVPTLIDSTGNGDAPLSHIQAKASNASGFVFGSRSKQDLMEGLAVAIQRGKIGLPRLNEDEACQGENDPRIITQELKDFEYEHTRTGVSYSAPEGLHDDAVCALALAWLCFTSGQVVLAKPHTEKSYAPFAI